MRNPVIVTFNTLFHLLPGILAVAAVSFLAHHFSLNHGGPALLFALLLGMACSFFNRIRHTVPGVVWSSRTILHVGVALLGAKMGLDTFLSLGLAPVFTVLAGVSLTIFFAFALAKLLGLPYQLGLLTGGATAICGGSAAMAVSSLLPRDDRNETLTVFTIVTTTLLSSTCMVLYPLLARSVGLDDTHAGILIGAAIHDVAGAVGAGYTFSEPAGDTATIVKLMRVALLVPVCLLIALYLRRRGEGASHSAKVNFPGFLLAFLLLSALASLHFLPETAIRHASEVSRWCLLMAMAALGMKTSLGKLRHVGLKPVLLMVSNTIFLLAVVSIALTWY
ncbi:MAG: putative sulfate exporter family transporter [Alphaproteobacteria bacterium]|nr:putative sulfate exporter family transporter [Alphaproteobacteria bacterium]